MRRARPGVGEAEAPLADARVDRTGQAATFAVAACLALVLKTFYARADAEALDFVLAPTAALVEAATGLVFEREVGGGFLCREAAYLIAPACAGLNFTIAAFASLVLGFTPARAPLPARATRLAAFALVALVSTPLVNATRITLDLTLRPPISLADPASFPAWIPLLDGSGLSRAELHRIEGIVVSLIFLWLLQAAAERLLDPAASAPSRILVPLAAYLAITLGVPLLNPFAPGPGHPALSPHLRVVLTTSLALALPMAGLRAALRLRRRRPAPGHPTAEAAGPEVAGHFPVTTPRRREDLC